MLSRATVRHAPQGNIRHQPLRTAIALNGNQHRIGINIHMPGNNLKKFILQGG
jgi:hypothetical protein